MNSKAVRKPEAPGPLATPTSLGADVVQAVAEAVNPLIADAVALYLKTKNFHWHLAGPRFRDYHLLFDEQAAVVLDSVDVLAERIRKLGGGTIKSIGHVARLQTIQDDNEDFVPAVEMVRRLLTDNRKMADAQRAAIHVCEDHDDSPTANILQDLLDQTERRIWFLFEVTQRDEDDGR